MSNAGVFLPKTDVDSSVSGLTVPVRGWGSYEASTGFPAYGLFRSRYVAVALTAALGNAGVNRRLSAGSLRGTPSCGDRFPSQAKSYLEVSKADLGDCRS